MKVKFNCDYCDKEKVTYISNERMKYQLNFFCSHKCHSFWKKGKLRVLSEEGKKSLSKATSENNKERWKSLP